jgi:hypothetical protein
MSCGIIVRGARGLKRIASCEVKAKLNRKLFSFRFFPFYEEAAVLFLLWRFFREVGKICRPD